MSSHSDAPRSGRPTKVTAVIKTRVEELMRDKVGVGTRKVTKVINAELEAAGDTGKVDRKTIRNHLKTTEWGRRSLKVNTAPMLTPKNINDRLRFCAMTLSQGYLDPGHRGQLKRVHIIWTDEAWIPLHPEINKQNMRIRTSDPDLIPTYRKPKFGLKVMVAGAISTRGKSDLIFMDKGETVNKDVYRNKILPAYERFAKDRSLFPNQKMVTFSQDGAPAHTATTTMTYLEATFPTVWGKNVWPGNSPDLNPIEHLWNTLKESVLIEPRPKNRDELIARILVTWGSISQDKLLVLVESFVSRIAICAAKAGQHTGY